MKILKSRNKIVTYPILLFLTLRLRETYTRQVSQLQVTSKDLCPGLSSGQGEEKAEDGPQMDRHVEVISSSPVQQRPTAPLLTYLNKDPRLTAKRHHGGRGREGMEQERSAVLCMAVLLKGWWRIQLAAASWENKDDFSHYDPSCAGEIKYFITVCIIYSAPNSVKGFDGTV